MTRTLINGKFLLTKNSEAEQPKVIVQLWRLFTDPESAETNGPGPNRTPSPYLEFKTGSKLRSGLEQQFVL